MHRRNGALIQRPDIDIQAAADCCNLLRLLGIIRHDRRTAARKQNIRTIVYGYIVCNIMNERAFFPHMIQHFL